MPYKPERNMPLAFFRVGQRRDAVSEDEETSVDVVGLDELIALGSTLMVPDFLAPGQIHEGQLTVSSYVCDWSVWTRQWKEG